MNIKPDLLREIIAGSLLTTFLVFPQHYKLEWIAFVIFSITIAMIEKDKVYKIISNVLFLPITAILWTVSFFFAKSSATDYFNIKYGIFAENLNYSIQLKAGIIATVSIISIYCILLMIYFTIKMWKTRKQPLQEWFAHFPELAIHSFSCAFVFAFVVSLSQIADAVDTTILHLDAYQHSDCQTPENEIAIRKNDNTCYSFSPTGIVNWELKEYPRNKH